MEEKLDLFEELTDLAPFDTRGISCSTPGEYLMRYFVLNQPRTKFRSGAVQCHEGCARGFYDLYYLTKTMFSNVTLESVAKILLNMCEDYGTTRVSVYYNTDTDKVVFGNFEHKQRAISLLFDKSYRMFDIYGIDGLSFLDILSLAGRKLKNIVTIQTLPVYNWEQI